MRSIKYLSNSLFIAAFFSYSSCSQTKKDAEIVAFIGEFRNNFIADSSALLRVTKLYEFNCDFYYNLEDNDLKIIGNENTLLREKISKTISHLSPPLKRSNILSIELHRNFDTRSLGYIKSITLISKYRYDGFQFKYKIFQAPIKSLPVGFYGLPTSDGKTGGILNSNTIWFYQ